jgi:hypothetical protein
MIKLIKEFLLSGDDSEKSFFKRLEEDLKTNKQNDNNCYKS